jgi:hypothetical protein
MSWKGTWNGNVFIGTHTVDDGSGRVFMGAWTMTPALGSPHDPQLSNNDPFFNGAPLNEKSPDHFFGFFGPDDVWRGKYKDPQGRFEFSGTMTG